MKKRKNDELINAINLIYKEAEDKELSPENLTNLKPHIKIVANYLGVTQHQAFFFSVILINSFSGDTVSLHEIGRHLKVNTAQLINYVDDLAKMETKGILLSKPKRSSYSSIISNKEFIIHPDIVNAILLHNECPKIQKRKITNLLDALGEIYELMDRLDDNEISLTQYNESLSDFCIQHEKIEFFKKIKIIGLTNDEISVLVYMIWKALSGSTSVDIERLVKNIIEHPSYRMKFLFGLKSNENKLTKHELVDLVPSRFMNDIELKPSNKLADILKANGIPFEFEQSRQNGIITPGSIGEKTLFYSASESNQINAVQSMLDEENYRALMERLSSKKLPVSMNILLYGAPGTGKTESVLQLARMSGREIMKVEISQTKSMWFGESEKIIKKVFTDYTKYAEKCSKTPILFFNEADAILGKRNDLNGAVSQTQNTIQNILLEELENFKGIFMATTNLANNLDAAFERRFLFKVEFQKPSIESRTKIWMNKLSFLNEADASVLAQQFELSGGQIENVVRKSEIDFILQGQEVNLEKLQRFCDEETISGKAGRMPIGF